jgi:hypothetical protein
MLTHKLSGFLLLNDNDAYYDSRGEDNLADKD